MLESELKAKSEHIRTIIKARGISYPNITGKTFAVFRVDNRHHLMSIVSMIDPSPDWIVGISSLELCLRNCSWVESKILNLYPWDAGTDDGVTYISPNQPSSPRQPIRRIKPSLINDTRSPFYDPANSEMKPFAKLYLSRQRLYEKVCDPSIEDSQSQQVNCETEEWSDWSPCSATCGRGVKYKQRRYKNEESKYLCHKKLTERASCEAVQRYCPHKPPREIEDPLCELGPWGEWSSCSVTCGKGTKTRDRKFKNRLAAKTCAVGRRNPPLMQQNVECIGEGICEDYDETSQSENKGECKRKPWSQWSPCSATCGKGIKERYRLSLESEGGINWPLFKSYLNTYDESEELSEEDPCSNIKMKETVECMERPCAEEAVTKDVIACRLPKDVGVCKSNMDRWYFNNIRAECEIFSYSGCQGNLNNFRTLEQCQTLCAAYQKELLANLTAHKKQLDVTMSGILSYNIQNDGSHQVPTNLSAYGQIQVTRNLSKEAVDCEVSKWSDWTACNISDICGYGYMFKYRHITVFSKNGGRSCPKKLWKKRRCFIPCNKNLTYLSEDSFNYNHIKIDCVLSDWSPWTDCDGSCNSPKYQTRVRKILVHPSARGQPCATRIEQRLCLCNK